VFQCRDLAELRAGEVFLRGRTDDHINVAGRKVSPTIIEQALREHQAVAECVVFGVPSGAADRMDSIVACVAADRTGTKDELKQFLMRKLPGWQVPREWWFVDHISSNGAGKPSRAKWRQSFLENRARAAVKIA
jgi:acyl-CoA synthetase (AMP-forming)/AMP-acid ligase II